MARSTRLDGGKVEIVDIKGVMTYPHEPKTDRADFITLCYNTIARRKLNLSGEYIWMVLEGIGPDTLVTMAKHTVFASGPRKGKRKYLKETAKLCCVTKAEYSAVEKELKELE